MATFLAGLAVISLFGRLLGAALLAEYLLIRRVAGWLNGAQLGLGVALPRYVAHAVGNTEGKQEGYLVATAACLGIFAAALLVPFNLLAATFGRLLFGDPSFENLIPPLSIFFLALMVQGLVYGYYRGYLRMGRANALQFWTLGAVPLLAVGGLFQTHSVILIVTVMGALTTLISILFAVPILRLLFVRGCPRVLEPATELLRYGIPRMPGDFAGGALLTLGPVIASHYVAMDRVAYLLLGISILMALSVSTGPVGLILLSKVSMMLAQNRHAEVRSQLKHLLAAVVELSTFVTLQIVVFTDLLVRIWVGHAFSDQITVVRIVLLASPFFLLNTALRSVIDAASVKAYTARNSVISLIAFLVFAGVIIIVFPAPLLVEGLAGSLLLALIVLAWLTHDTVRQLFEVSIPWSGSVRSILLSLVLGGVALLIHWSNGFRTGVVALMAIEMASSLTFLGMLIWGKSPWLQVFWNTAFSRRSLIPVTDGRN